MNSNPGSVEEKAKQNAALQKAFRKMSAAALTPRHRWDQLDQLAFALLESFERVQRKAR